MRLQIVLAASFLALGLSSCLFSSNRKVDTSGQYISPTTMEQVKPGETQEFVQALFGEPTTKVSTESDEGDSEIWKWSYSTDTRDTGSVFLIASSSTRSHAGGAVYVEFQEGEVVKVWRD